MKKILTMMLLALLCSIAAQAQENDYQPLVREGVRWVNHASMGGEDFYAELSPYVIEFHGDTIITRSGESFHYKKCYKYDLDIQESSASIQYEEMFPVALVREVDKKIYIVDFNKSDSERILYDFSSSEGNILIYDEDGTPNAYRFIETIVINSCPCNVYEGNLGKVIESVGLVSQFMGDSLWPKWYMVTGVDYFYGLDYLEDLEGNILYKSPWYKEPEDYQPLVREGVRWHTAYIENPGGMESNYHYVDNKIEFRGDTILSGVTYKKCYMYETTSWTPEARLIGYARDAFGQVMIVYDEEHGDWFVPDETHTIPGDLYDLTGERVIYDFSDMEGFVEGWGTHDKIVSVNTIPLGTKEVTRYVMVDGYNHVYYIVEGVGCDKPDHSVCPITPFSEPPTGNVSRWGGLIMLTNLDDEPLYKGSLYEKYRMQEYTDLNGDGKVDVSDVNEVINVVLGKSTASADITGDGKVDISDVNAVINVMLGK